MKAIFLISLLAISMVNVSAQKQTFGIVSFSAPKGWQQKQSEGGLQLSVTDNKTGGYALALITVATTSNVDANSNFKSEWERLIKGNVQVDGDIVMSEPTKENGWDIVSGGANYTDKGNKGMATLLTATGAGQMASVILMTNAKQYQDDLLAFLNSLEMQKAAPNTTSGVKPSTINTANNSTLNGMWVFYNTESSGMYNGFPQLTGGYMRREYVFKSDGTYIFRAKDWMLYVKDILFVYETGTYTVNGNQITITPQKGKGEWWSKVSNNTSAWGKLVRASTEYKLEKTAYTFEYFNATGNNEKVLILKSAKPTAREGKDGDNKAVQEFRYTSRASNKSLIDNPPGFKS